MLETIMAELENKERREETVAALKDSGYEGNAKEMLARIGKCLAERKAQIATAKALLAAERGVKSAGNSDGKRGRKAKPVQQISLETGEVIRVWDSAGEAALGLTGNKNNQSAIYSHLKDEEKHKSAMGFRWATVSEAVAA